MNKSVKNVQSQPMENECEKELRYPKELADQKPTSEIAMGSKCQFSLKREKRADSQLLNFQANPGDLVAIDSTWQGAKVRTLEGQGLW